MRYEFTRPIVVEGKQFQPGAVIAPGEIPAGCLESCLWTKAIKELAEPTIEMPKASPQMIQPPVRNLPSAAKK